MKHFSSVTASFGGMTNYLPNTNFDTNVYNIHKLSESGVIRLMLSNTQFFSIKFSIPETLCFFSRWIIRTHPEETSDCKLLQTTVTMKAFLYELKNSNGVSQASHAGSCHVFLMAVTPTRGEFLLSYNLIQFSQPYLKADKFNVKIKFWM